MLRCSLDFLRIAQCGSVLLIFGLAGCAHTLAAPESAAFAKLATADQDVFTNLADSETQSGLGLSQALLHNNIGRVITANCGSEATGDCVLTYLLPSASYQLTASALHTRALIRAVARYSDQMATLADAKDLADIKAKTDAAANTLKTLISLIPAAGLIAAPVIDFAQFVGNASLRDQRRRAMLTVATAAQPIIDLAARSLGEEAISFKSNISKDAAAAVLETQRSIIESQNRELSVSNQAREANRQPPDGLELARLKQQRAIDMATLLQEAQALNIARHLPTDFSVLATAHRTLIARLKDPSISVEVAMSNVESFLSILDEVKAAGKKL